MIDFETNDLSIVKKKMEAFSTLFDASPTLHIGGYWQDKQGEMVHFRTSTLALSLGRKWILANVDGKLENVTPTEAWFSIGV